MTDYNPLADTTIDSDSFAIQDIFFHLRDNAIAITEGSPGAPKIKNKALELFNDYVLDHFGGGGLGAVTISTNTTYQPGAREYTNFTVDSGVTLTKGDNYPGPLIIKCNDTLTINGTIKAENAFTNYDAGASGGSGGGASSGFSSDGTNSTFVAEGVSGVAAGNNGNAGKNAEVSGIEALLTTVNSCYHGASPGSNGKTGTSGSGGAGGVGGGVIILIADTIDFNTGAKLDVSGADGGAGSGVSGSGGGGGGGLILMLYRTLNTDSGTYDVAGGAGGTGGETNGGAGGNGYTFKKDIAQ